MFDQDPDILLPCSRNQHNPNDPVFSTSYDSLLRRQQMKHHIDFVEDNAVISIAINYDSASVTNSRIMLLSGSHRSTMIQDDNDGESRDKVSL